MRSEEILIQRFEPHQPPPLLVVVEDIRSPVGSAYTYIDGRSQSDTSIAILNRSIWFTWHHGGWIDCRYGLNGAVTRHAAVESVEPHVGVVVKVDPVVASVAWAAACSLLVVVVLVEVVARVAGGRVATPFAGNLDRFGNHLTAQSCAKYDYF